MHLYTTRNWSSQREPAVNGAATSCSTLLVVLADGAIVPLTPHGHIAEMEREKHQHHLLDC